MMLRVTIDSLPFIFSLGSFCFLSFSILCACCNGTRTLHRELASSPTSYNLKLKAVRTTIATLLSIPIIVSQHQAIPRPSGYAFGGNLSFAIAYGTLVTYLSVLGPELGSHQLTRHADLVFLCAFAIVAYRDLWPFFTLEGETPSLDMCTIVADALLAILGIIIPLISPRGYRPIGNIMPGPPKLELHPEQTASWLSLLLFSWLNPLIREAYKSQHLAPNVLFPLADYDHITGLVSRNSTHLLSRTHRNRHIFFCLMKAFSTEYAMLVFLALVQVVLNLASPFALEQFLNYLEAPGIGVTTIRPIVWILLLLLSPVIYSISCQWSTFIATRVAVHIEALLSDLVLKHTLRIRLQGGENADIPSDGGISNSQTNLGMIHNHMTTDLTNISGAKEFLPMAVGIPTQIVLCMVFLHQVLGWSALVGALTMTILFPLPGYIASLFQSVEAEKMRKTDGRVQLVGESMNVLRMIKLFGWERKICSKIQERRVEELVWNRKRALLELLNDMVIFIVPISVMLVTFSVYTAIAGQNLTASIVFSSIAVFDILHTQLHMVSGSIPLFIQGKVSLDRINAFLLRDDIVSACPGTTDTVRGDGVTSDIIGVSHATFSWSKSEPDTETHHSKPFVLSIHDELVFQRRELNLVTGPTGSGKTSLLMALLGEMHSHQFGPKSWYNLPRHLGVAYVAQESWILNCTIRDNIIFDSQFDEGRYKDVLSQCALEPDLALMDHGDLTEVGEKGVTLSGGQKIRITLARAIYSSAEILLLDDVFAALDVHTSHWIVTHCFRGKLVKGRTVIMTTHDVSLVHDIAQYVVTLGNDGRIQSHGPVNAGANGATSASDVIQDGELEKDTGSSDSDSALGKSMGIEDGTLTATEDVAEGHVSWSAVLLYLLSWGGRMPILNWALFIFGLFATHVSFASQSWYLGYWAGQYQKSDAVNVVRNLITFTLILSSTVVIYSLSRTLHLLRLLSASRVIHNQLVEQIFGSTFRWLDTTPVARVITRCTQDIGTVDETFPSSLWRSIELAVAMVVKLVAIVYLAPPFALPGLVVAIAGGWCGQVYMKAELSVKRELSNAKAPLLAELGTVLTGLVSIRAFSAQNRFIREYQSYIDNYTKVARTFHALNCWVVVRLEALGALFTASLAAYLLYGDHNIGPSDTGFSLAMAVSFSALILHLIITYNMTEINANSLERIASYMTIEQEAEPIHKASTPAYWPASGDLRVENLSARYSSDGPDVLHNLTFHIHSGERIGIVGRTGSGKTSLTLSLMHCLFTEGNVYYDGMLTSSIPLETLRSSLTIIPQSAELLNGTIRQNLDPFEQFEDATLYDALRSAGLSEVQQGSASHESGNRLTLDTTVTAGGTNLSIGQRQMVALARAMVRESKLLILDEATSAIDHKTDAAIQRSLHEMKGVTQLIIAHRLRSVMNTDRIIVLDAGQIVELDTPRRLLQREDGIFRALVYASKDKEALLAAVR